MDNHLVNHTELEWHIIDDFRGTPDAFEENSNHHILMEFVDGYAREIDGKRVYADPDNYDLEVKLLDEFIRIVNLDIAGGYEYNSVDYTYIVKAAIDKFGL